MSFYRRQRKWEGAGYHQHRNELPLDAPSQAQPQRCSSHCTTFSTCKWQCHQMLSFHQSSRGGHEYTKGKAETGCLPQLYLAQLYRLGFLLWASTFCFSLKGTVLGSPGLNQGRSRILDLSSGLQMQVKCGHQMSSFFYIITAGGQRQQGSVQHPFFQCTLCHIPCTEVLPFTQTQDQTTRPLQPPPSPRSAAACLPLSLPQLSDHSSELAF